MKIFLVYWPSKTFSLITANDYRELFWKIDDEGDPCWCAFICVTAFHLEAAGDDGSKGLLFKVLDGMLASKRWIKFNFEKDGNYDKMYKGDNEKPWDWSLAKDADKELAAEAAAFLENSLLRA